MNEAPKPTTPATFEAGTAAATVASGVVAMDAAVEQGGVGVAAGAGRAGVGRAGSDVGGRVWTSNMEAVLKPGFGEVDEEAFALLLRAAGLTSPDGEGVLAAAESLLRSEEALLAEAATMVHPDPDWTATASAAAFENDQLTLALEEALAAAEASGTPARPGAARPGAAGPGAAEQGPGEEAVDALLARVAGAGADAAAAMAAHVAAIDDTTPSGS